MNFKNNLINDVNENIKTNSIKKKLDLQKSKLKIILIILNFI